MSLKLRLIKKLANWIDKRGGAVTIERSDGKYLTRYFIFLTDRFSLYLHCFHNSDEDFRVHDHPWNNASYLLDGEYREHFADTTSRICKPGDFNYRQAEVYHRVELLGSEVWTLFAMGKRRRFWTFLNTQTGGIETITARTSHGLKGILFPHKKD